MVKHVKHLGGGKLGPVVERELAGGRKPISSRRFLFEDTPRPPHSSLPARWPRYAFSR